MANLTFRNFLSVAKYRLQLLARHPRILILLVVLVFGIAAGAVSFIYISDRKAPLAKIACTDTLLEKADSQINDPKKVNDLTKTVNTIKTQANYEKDANCLDVMVSYYIRVGDPENASVYLTKLEQAYNPKTGFSPKLIKVSTNIQTLKDQVAFLRQAQSEVRQNSEKISAYGSKRQ